MENKRPEPKFDWFVPIDGDGFYIGTLKAERPPKFEYLLEVVRAAEINGFYSMLIPTRFSNGLFDENADLSETWTTVTALATLTSKMRFIVAVRPGFISTGLFAHMVATLDQISGGRIDINVVPGGIGGDLERLGENIDHASRYKRAEEFISACRSLWNSPGPVEFNGDFVNLNGAVVSPGPIGDGPLFYLGGASESAIKLAAQKADVYLSWIRPREEIGKFIDKSNEEYFLSGRTPKYGLRSHIIVRDTEDEAFLAADQLISQADDSVKKQRNVALMQSKRSGMNQPTAILKGHKLGAHLWTGISTVRVNCGTALVGNYTQIANELLQYWRLGIDEFILSGYPHLEESNRVSENLIPVARKLIMEERSYLNA